MKAKRKTKTTKLKWYDKPYGTIILSVASGLFLKGLYVAIDRFAKIITSLT